MDSVYKNRLLLLANALRNGKYLQNTKHNLRDSDGFSINGVAIDLYSEMTGKGNWDNNAFYDMDGEWTSLLSDNASSFFYGTRNEAHISINGENLSSLHGQRTSFKKMADIIEKYINE